MVPVAWAVLPAQWKAPAEHPTVVAQVEVLLAEHPGEQVGSHGYLPSAFAVAFGAGFTSPKNLGPETAR